MGRQRSSREVRLGSFLVLCLLAAMSSTGCAGKKVQDADMRAVWVPREGSQGLVIDEDESKMRQMYRPATGDEKRAASEND